MQNPENKNLEVVINHHTFKVSLLEIITLILDKTEKHTKLYEACNQLIEGFKDDNFDQGRIIKKIYKTLSIPIYTQKMIDQDITLFNERNNENKIVTIIPGINIGSVIGSETFNKEDLQYFWGNLYIVYVSTVKMIASINKHNKIGDKWKTVEILQEKITNMGMLSEKNKKLFNPFIGLTNNLLTSTDTIIENSGLESVSAQGGLSPEMTTENFTQMLMSKIGGEKLASLGLEKMLNLDKLNEQLKNINQNDIDDATNNITNMLGATDDSDVKDVCSELVGNIVSELKTNGIKDIFSTAKTVSDKIGSQMDKNKMKKTASHLGNFMKNAGENMKSMKDENGNPIVNDDMMKMLTNSLKMFQGMGGNKQ